LGQKHEGLLFFNQRIVAQYIFNLLLFKASHQSSAQAYKANKQAKTKNSTPTKRKLLKERTNGYVRFYGHA
jgi:hypothetical protein